MSFIQSAYHNLQHLWEQPSGSYAEDFKDLSKTQKAAVLFCTTAVAVALPIIFPLAILTFRSLVDRCTEKNEDKKDQQEKIEKNEAFKWIKTRYENSKDFNDTSYEIETFDSLYTFVKKNPSYMDRSDFNNIVRRINLKCEQLNIISPFEII